MGEWESGTSPWFRSQAKMASRVDRPIARCYFCGEESAILSFGDLAQDHGRIEIYCDNGQCDAREMTIIVERGEGASDRADVRLLRGLDEESTSEAPPELRSRSLAEWASERSDADVAARRTSTYPVTVAVYGPGN